MKYLIALLIAVMAVPLAAQTAPQSESAETAQAAPIAAEAPIERPFLQRVRAALDAETRPNEDRERDANRLPVETLDFFGLTENMRVLELVPGGGWYTRLLAPALANTGKLYVALGTARLAQSGMLAEPALAGVEVLEPAVAIAPVPGSRLVTIGPFEFGVDNLDAVLTFRNLHNFDAAGRMNLNRAVFDALKPGGIYGVVDHTRRHMQPDEPENRRRVDPVRMIKEIEAAGFVFEDYSDLHYRPDDELRYEVGRKTVTGNTDRFTFLFRKPE